MLTAVSVVTIVMAIAGAWLWSRNRPESNGRAQRHSRPQRESRPRAAASPAKPKERFGAVEIRLRGAACHAARALDGQRYLVHEAPKLPLASCSSPSCTCSFVKLSDRRTEDRRLEYEGNAAAFRASDRREQVDRRGKE